VHPAPRVAYFPDSFHEVNGVAHTSRHLEAFARRRNLPFLSVRAGDRGQTLMEHGNVWTLELPRGSMSRRSNWFLRLLPREEAEVAGQTIQDLALCPAAVITGEGAELSIFASQEPSSHWC
jgi:hypothetical protein